MDTIRWQKLYFPPHSQPGNSGRAHFIPKSVDSVYGGKPGSTRPNDYSAPEPGGSNGDSLRIHAVDGLGKDDGHINDITEVHLQ